MRKMPEEGYLWFQNLRMATHMMVHGTEVTVTRFDDKDYISLTDMLKAKDGDSFYLRLAS